MTLLYIVGGIVGYLLIVIAVARLLAARARAAQIFDIKEEEDAERRRNSAATQTAGLDADTSRNPGLPSSRKEDRPL